MRPIPPKLRRQLSEDSFMKRCVYCGSPKDIEWEHSWIYAGRQINEWWAIVPLCRDHHRGKYASAKVKRYGKWHSIMRGLKEAVQKYPRMNWHQIKKTLDKEFLPRI